MSGFLLDTNVVSDLRRPRPNGGLVDWIDSVDETRLFLSVIAIGELRIGIEMQPVKRKRAALETWLVSDLFARFAGRILAFDIHVAERWGRLEGRACSIGISPSVASALRLITMILIEKSEDWMTERRYMSPESLELVLQS